MRFARRGVGATAILVGAVTAAACGRAPPSVVETAPQAGAPARPADVPVALLVENAAAYDGKDVAVVGRVCGPAVYFSAERFVRIAETAGSVGCMPVSIPSEGWDWNGVVHGGMKARWFGRVTRCPPGAAELFGAEATYCLAAERVEPI